MKHLKLFLAILFFVSLGSVSIAQSDSGVIKLIEPNDLLNTLKSSKIQLVDVRTPSEFATGHIGKSVNIDYYDQDFSAKIGKLDKSKPIYLYCRSGVRSSNSAEILKKLGFKTIYDLKGGVLNWSAQKMPLEK
ncbi:MAG: rhodanese-like domain-containing protein [Flavobacteriales bacterium CG_4_8_14_3_um_filter_35_10]|nr:MAG: rhodanese-like domain-containing protein [Flavobacteriales bacterium CG_4_8_14_3_um_filter_35_10]